VGYIASVDAANNILKIKLADIQREFSVSEIIRSNIITTISSANGSLNSLSLPFQADRYSTSTATKTANITSISPSNFIAEKNAFTQNPIVRLYSIYYPGEWYPPNEYGNPSGAGAGYAWPSIFPIRIAEIVGDIATDIQYNVSYAGTTYQAYPVNLSGLEQASDGRVNELSLSLYNVQNLISVLVEDPYLVGRNISNSVSAIVNGQMVSGIDPRTVGSSADANIVSYYGTANASFDKFQTEAIGGVWEQQKADTRDLLGAAVEIKTTFANFLDYWPEYSRVTAGYANNYTLQNSFPYRIGDVLTTGNARYGNATIQYIAANNSITVSKPLVPQLHIGNDDTAPNGMFLRPVNGNHMLVVGNTDDDVYRYTMSTSFDITTATLTDSFSISQDNNPTGVAVSSNSLVMYIVGSQTDNIYQYSLSSAYALSNATYVTNFYVGDREGNPQGLVFNDSGTNFYVTGASSDRVHQYATNTAWNIANATYVSNVSVADTFPRDLFLKADGTQLYILGGTTSRIYQYDLSEVNDISTATLVANAYIGNYEGTATGIAIRRNGTTLYLSGTSTDTIYQIPMSTAWDITTLANNLTIPVGTPLYITNLQSDTESYLQDVYKIDQLESLSEHVANFSLVSWLQYFKIVTPKRKYYKNTCQWVYKGDECQYPGPGGGLIPGTTLSAPATAIAANNMIMPTSAGDVCAKSLVACTLRNNSLHFGGFPGVGRTVPQM
jgi:phage-related protein